MLKVVVAGGSGFLGQRLVASLVQRGDAVTVLARDPDAARGKLGGRAQCLGWSLEPGAVREAWEREVRDATAVVNLAGAGVMDRRWTEARKRELTASRIDVTLALARTMAASSASQRSPTETPRVFVSASAIGFYGTRAGDAVMTEGSPPGADFLAELCVAWEAAATSARDAGIRVVHPRIGIVLGREGGALPELVRSFRLHAGGPIGSGEQWVSWIHEQDAVGALELALTSGSMHGAFNLVAPRPVTMAEEAETLAKVLHTHARVRVPAFVLTALLGEGRAEAILTGQRASSERLRQAGYVFAFEELLPALQDLLAA
jgi:uncharacterized protein (TIGR01777 family)